MGTAPRGAPVVDTLGYSASPEGARGGSLRGADAALGREGKAWIVKNFAKDFGKQLALWIIIGLLLVAVFNLFHGTDMRPENVPAPINFLVNWWPMLLLIALGLFVIRQVVWSERRRNDRPRG
jgi:hypothetical protein